MTKGLTRNPSSTGGIHKNRQFWVELGISGILLGVSLYILLSKNYSEEYVKWSFGMVGTIFGYWIGGRNK